jgi:hypothetical protein
MKIRTRDAGLLAVGYVLGSIFMALLVTAPIRPASAPAPTGRLAQPVLAVALPPPPVMTMTNIQWQAPPIHRVLPPRLLDSLEPETLFPPPRRPLDLIDTRYQPPDIKLEDLN